GPVQVTVPPDTPRSVGETFVTAMLLCTFSVTLTVPPWRTKLLPTLSAVLSAGGPGSTPGVAGVGPGAPNLPPPPRGVGGAVRPVGYGSITRAFCSRSSLLELGASV